MRAIKIALLLALIIDALYLAGSVLVLNTSLFARMTEMEDESVTFLRFKGAFSPFPGNLWFKEGLVAIRDENVNLDIFAMNGFAKFDILPIFNRKIITQTLRVNQVHGNLHMKTDLERSEFRDNHPERPNLDLSRRFQLEFPNVEVHQITHASGPWGEFQGDASVVGAFHLQPGVSAEIFPSLLTLKDGSISEVFEHAHGELKVAFHRYPIQSTSGNEVFRYLDAEADLQARLIAFKEVKVKNGEKSNLHALATVQRGLLQAGSTVYLMPSEMEVSRPHVNARAKGRFVWKALRDHSELDANLDQLMIVFKEGAAQKLSIRDSQLHFFLEGIHLEHLFKGFLVELKLRRGKINFALKGGKANGLIQFYGSTIGRLGVISKKSLKNFSYQKPKIVFRVSPAELNLPRFPKVNLEGTLKIFTRPIVVESGIVQFEKVESDWIAHIKRHGEISIQVNIPELEWVENPSPLFRGKAKVWISSTDPIVNELQEQGRLGGFVSSLARVSDLESNLDLEIAKGRSFLKVNEVTSSGIWKASGAVMGNSFKGKNEITGAFEFKVAGLPVGVRFTPQGSETRLLPSKDWFPEFESEIIDFRSY